MRAARLGHPTAFSKADLARLKEKMGLTTDSQLAAALGVSPDVAYDLLSGRRAI